MTRPGAQIGQRAQRERTGHRVEQYGADLAQDDRRAGRAVALSPGQAWTPPKAASTPMATSRSLTVTAR